ncbi:uncharacterized protein Z518_08325 [Rhinocladiella mackenziei CBS 650.93]|uniref:Uncharacterized protein n=1 Tax=Rhinocladiella mackenziei CBS 650.93 TaxID=1442369 RepID=A0A0D2I978_9EURO|nr:uncharacterized protein Z518_08325 [Rhinocladiella mackenziei CBS 650.93]KIX02384.1 hypothetical protein Z518_08325 [Rhinocladiella mackenziei CBS 650.93]
MVQGKGAQNAYLSSYDREDALRVIIDAYRLRVETDHWSREEDHGIYYPGKPIDGLVWAQGDGKHSYLGSLDLQIAAGVVTSVLIMSLSIAINDFQRFLDLMEGSKILPKWWRFEDRMECLSLAIGKENPESIFRPINQTELPTRYVGDMAIRLALSLIAEMCVGYDGKGPAKDDTWFQEFQEFLDLHPEERARLIKGSIDMVNEAVKEYGHDLRSNPS